MSQGVVVGGPVFVYVTLTRGGVRSLTYMTKEKSAVAKEEFGNDPTVVLVQCVRRGPTAREYG
jgi:hypothetical protein